MDERIKALTAKGLTEQEARTALQWDGGALSSYHLDRAYQLYVSGSTCEAIAFRHQEYTIPMLQAARAQFEWDKHREYRKQNLIQNAVNGGDEMQPSIMMIIHRMVGAIDTRYTAAFERYITDPANNKFPEMEERHFIQLKEALKMTRDMMGLNDKDMKDKPMATILTPIIKIKVSSQGNQPMKIAPPVVEIDPIEMRRQRLLDAGMVEEANAIQPTGKNPSPTDG